MFINGKNYKFTLVPAQFYTDYINDLVRKKILPESVLETLSDNNKDRKFLAVSGTQFSFSSRKFYEAIDSFRELGLPIQNISNGYDKITGFLKYASVPLSSEKESEMEKVYGDHKLISTGRSYVVKNNERRNAEEFYYNGKLYARSILVNDSSSRRFFPDWYEVTSLDYIIDYSKNNIFSTQAVIPNNVFSEYDTSFEKTIKQQTEGKIYKGDSEDFTLSSTLHTIEHGEEIVNDDLTNYIPYGVSSVKIKNTADRDFLVFPRTVRSIDFTEDVRVGSCVNLDCLELCDNVTFGEYIKFNVNDKIVLHYHDADTMLSFLEQLSNHLLNTSRKYDFGNRFEKVINLVSKKGLKLVLELHGPRLSLTKKDKDSLKSYGFNYYFIPEDDYRVVDDPEIFKEDVKDSKEESEYQKKVNDIYRELVGYKKYYLDGDKRINDFREAFDAITALLSELKTGDRVTEKNVIDADTIFKEFFQYWNDILDKYRSKDNYYKVIDYIDSCDAFLDGKNVECDGLFFSELVSHKRMAELVDEGISHYYKELAKRYLSIEKKLVQDFIGKEKKDFLSEEESPCESIEKLETKFDYNFSELFSLIENAANAMGIKEIMLTDLWRAFAKPHDDANKQQISFLEKTANEIVGHIKDLATTLNNEGEYIEKCSNIINYFKNSSLIDDADKFKNDLIELFPELFPDKEHASVFVSAHDYCKPLEKNIGNKKLEELSKKYIYMTAALMSLEAKLEEEASRTNRFNSMLGVRLPDGAGHKAR